MKTSFDMFIETEVLENEEMRSKEENSSRVVLYIDNSNTKSK